LNTLAAAKFSATILPTLVSFQSAVFIFPLVLFDYDCKDIPVSGQNLSHR
jgi:hypothetical protein